jgi:prepilin-type N-terminal cleavage/methylation domain-containing protein
MNTKNAGFTIIEVLVVLGLIVVIVGAAGGSLITMLTTSTASSNQAQMLTQVQNTGSWITRDVSSANPGTVTVNAQGLPSMSIDTWTGSAFVTQSIVYAFDANHALWRRINGASPGQLIAQDLDVAVTAFSLNGSTFRLTVKSIVSDRSITRTYEMSGRSA